MSLDMARVNAVLGDVAQERQRQHAKWNEQNHPSGTGEPWQRALAESAQFACQQAEREGIVTMRHILAEEVAEAFAESDPVKLREELVQVAAVACQWIEALDRAAPTEARQSLAQGRSKVAR